MNFERDWQELQELSTRYCGTADLQICLEKLSWQTGWQVEQLMRWSLPEIIDALHVVMGERATSDARKDRALYLWNNGMTWQEVAKAVDDDESVWKTLSQEVKRYANAKGYELRGGKRGRIGKTE